MRARLLTLPAAAAIAILLWTVGAEAHHSFSSAYKGDETITLEGTIVQISFRSPHSFFYIEVEDVDGEAQQWAIEGASSSQFARQGVDSSAFSLGDPVEVTVNPSRFPNSARARLVTIVRTTDGKSWGTRAGEVVD